MLSGFKDIVVAETTGHTGASMAILSGEVPLQFQLSPRLRILDHDSPPGQRCHRPCIWREGSPVLHIFRTVIPHAQFVISNGRKNHCMSMSMTVQFGLELLCGYIVTSFRHQREIELSLVSLLFTAEAHDEGQDCASLKISSSWAYRGSKRPRLRNIRARAHAVADKRS